MNSTGLMLEFIMGTGRTTRDTVKEHSLSRTEKLYLAIGRTERSNMYQLQIIQVFSIINFNHINSELNTSIVLNLIKISNPKW